MRWLVFLIPVLFAALSGCATSKVASYNAGTPGAYTLDTGDQLRVVVYGDETLSSTYTVTDKGTISFPLAGQVVVRGQTITTAERMITELLSNGYMINPKVSVEVVAYRPFFIDGAVSQGGQYPYVYGMTVRSAVATAGGFKDFADRSHATVYRRIGKAMTKQSVGLDEVILPGDTVVVAERWL